MNNNKPMVYNNVMSKLLLGACVSVTVASDYSFLNIAAVRLALFHVEELVHWATDRVT